MRSHSIRAAVITALALPAAAVMAQGASTSVEQRLQKLEAEQAAMKQQIEQRDARIRELERELHEGSPPAPSPQPAPGQSIVVQSAAVEQVPAVPATAETVAVEEARIEEDRKPTPSDHETWGVYDPGLGFLVARTKAGELDISAYALARYMDQHDSDGVFTDHLGNVRTVDPRRDIYSHRVLVWLKGWLVDPKLTYAITLWTVNATEQNAIFANVGYAFSKHFNLYAGVVGNPGSRSLQGSHPYWLGNDRVMADEFFRPYFGQGVYANGELVPGLWYSAVVANSNSTLGTKAVMLDRELTRGGSLWWMPTTKEFGPRGAYGDWEWHEDVATRFGISTTFSPEQSFADAGKNPGNTTLRLADSVNLFETGSLAPGVTINFADYTIVSVDAGLKYKGMFLQAEYYARTLDKFQADGLLPVASIKDTGFYVQGSFYPIPKVLELYAATSQIYGDKSAGFGNSSEYLAGANWYPFHTRNHRLNVQLMDVNKSPVSSVFGYYTGGQDGWTLATAFSVFF